VYRAQGRYSEAIVEIQEALRIRQTPLLYAILAGVLYRQHRFNESVTAVETAIELSRETYWLWGNLGAYSKWAPGNEAKSQAALRRAKELATKVAEADKSDFDVRANLAEYEARLGDSAAALKWLDLIPESARPPLTTRFALVYELTGHHDRAIAVVRRNMTNPAALNQIKDDPDLASVWRSVR
jgi:tetratricopeptide (TPR) repeat protein